MSEGRAGGQEAEGLAETESSEVSWALGMGVVLSQVQCAVPVPGGHASTELRQATRK